MLASSLYDFWIIKLDAAGNKKWDKSYGGWKNDYLKSLQQTSDGGYILGGTSDSPIGGKAGFNKTTNTLGEHDYWLVKVDAAGVKQWDKTFGGSSFDYLQTVLQTSDKGFILAGYSYSVAGGNKSAAAKGFGDFWIVKTDAAGNKQWDKAFGGNLEESLSLLRKTKDGGYLLGGISKSGVSGDKTAASKGFGDFWIVKLDAAGNKKWDKSLGGKNNDYLQAMEETTDGGYILGGTSDSPVSGDKSAATNGNSDFWLVKVDASGNKKWDKTVGGNGYDNLQSLQSTTNGGFIVSGTSNSVASGDKSLTAKGETDFWVINMNVAGVDNTSEDEDTTVDEDSVTQQPQYVVQNFTLVNADTDKDIITLTDGDILNLATLPTTNLNIRANTNTPTLDSLAFALSGAQTRTVTETAAPYVLFGTVGTDYNAWVPAVGTYTLQGTPYATTTDSSQVTTALTITFSVVNQPAANILPTVSAGKDIQITLPTNIVTLSGLGSDADGTIAAYSWNQVSGPATAIFSSKTAAYPKVSGLVAGTYVFALTVTDNKNEASVADQVSVTVNNLAVGQQLVSFTLINADTDKDLFTLTEGATLNLATLPTKNLNIRANINTASTKSITLDLSGRWTMNKLQTEPCTLFGDKDGDYVGIVFSLGNYTLKATPYAGDQATGIAGTSLTINFKVINQATSTTINTKQTTSNATPAGTSQIINNQADTKVSSQTTFTSFPNPFQTKATIEFTFAQTEDYKLDVYDMNGILVNQIKTGKALAGETVRITWDGNNKPNGIYLLKLTTKNTVKHLRIVHGK